MMVAVFYWTKSRVMSVAATASTNDPRSYKSGSHKTGSYGSSNRGSPDYEDEPILDIRRMVYENPSLGSFGPFTFQELENSDAEAQHALDFIAARRYKFVFPEQADMYLSALTHMFFVTKCQELFKTTKNMSIEEINAEVKKTKAYYAVPVANRPFTCKQKMIKFRDIFNKIRDGMMRTASTQGSANIKSRVEAVIQQATGGNLTEQFSQAEINKYSEGGSRRRRARKSSRKNRRNTRRNRKNRRNTRRN
jgi:hypothetical protein